MSQPPRYFATIVFALFALCFFLIPLILIVYVGHAFFFGPVWLAAQPGVIQVMVECFMVVLGAVGLFIQWLGFWAVGLVMSAKARYEFRYTHYIREGNDPSDWARHSL